MQNNFVQPHHYFKTYTIHKYPRGINALILRCHPEKTPPMQSKAQNKNKEIVIRSFRLKFSVSVRDLPLLDCPLEQCFLTLRRWGILKPHMGMCSNQMLSQKLLAIILCRIFEAEPHPAMIPRPSSSGVPQSGLGAFLPVLHQHLCCFLQPSPNVSPPQVSHCCVLDGLKRDINWSD